MIFGNKMDSNIATPLISAGGSVLVAMTALILNYRGFAAMEGRFASMDSRFASMDSRFASIERRLDVLQTDMKDLNKTMTALEIDVALVKDKVGL
jgi:hypothetical protein